jgi:hypothetical protein
MKISSILNTSTQCHFFEHEKISTQKMNFEILTKRSNNILFKTKHLTKKGKNMFFKFFCVTNFFMCMIKKLMFNNIYIKRKKKVKTMKK